MRHLLIFAVCLLSSAYLPANEPLMNAASQQQFQLLLYYSPHCPYSQRVLNYLQSIHKKVPMRNVVADGSAKSDLKSIGGKSQVPCLMIDGRAMYESADIIQWLSQHQDALEASP